MQQYSQDENLGSRCLSRLPYHTFSATEGLFAWKQTCICKGEKSTGGEEETCDLHYHRLFGFHLRMGW